MLKRIALLSLAALLLTTPALATIVGSPHDMSAHANATVNSMDTEGRVCVYCHTPHNPNTPASITGGALIEPPLWNRNAGTSATQYNMYNSTYSPTIDMNVPDMTAADLNGSTICLSCHDGTVTLGSIFNAPEEGTITAGITMAAIPTGDLWNQASVIGTDLRNDHPVNVQWDISATGDQDFNAPDNATTGYWNNGIHLINDEVHCASCHDPHDYDTYRPFLLTPNTNSDLCLTCHAK